MRWLILSVAVFGICQPSSAGERDPTRSSGLRVYDGGRYRWLGSSELLRVDRSVLQGHQPWRKNCSLVALAETRSTLPGDAAKWSEVHFTKPGFAALTYDGLLFPTVSYDVNWHDARWTRVTVVAEIAEDSLPRWSRKIALRRTPGGVYWVTGVWKLRPSE